MFSYKNDDGTVINFYDEQEKEMLSNYEEWKNRDWAKAWDKAVQEQDWENVLKEQDNHFVPQTFSKRLPEKTAEEVIEMIYFLHSSELLSVEETNGIQLLFSYKHELVVFKLEKEAPLGKIESPLFGSVSYKFHKLHISREEDGTKKYNVDCLESDSFAVILEKAFSKVLSKIKKQEEESLDEAWKKVIMETCWVKVVKEETGKNRYEYEKELLPSETRTVEDKEKFLYFLKHAKLVNVEDPCPLDMEGYQKDYYFDLDGETIVVNDCGGHKHSGFISPFGSNDKYYGTHTTNDPIGNTLEKLINKTESFSTEV